MPEGAAESLSLAHERRISVTCRYIDKLLDEMESALDVSASRRAFPQYAMDLNNAQRQKIEQYIGSIREHLVRLLDDQAIERPPADIPVSRSLHANLTFMHIAIEELKPQYMRGYGEIPAAPAAELNSATTALQRLIKELDGYLMGQKEVDAQ